MDPGTGCPRASAAELRPPRGEASHVDRGDGTAWEADAGAWQVPGSAKAGGGGLCEPWRLERTEYLKRTLTARVYDVAQESPLEAAATARVKAGQINDADVDLSAWALPDKTAKMARAQQVLRRLAVRWWFSHQKKVAEAWLATGERTEADREGVTDALRRMKAATYFTWPRGSRHLFWKVEDPNWRQDF